MLKNKENLENKMKSLKSLPVLSLAITCFLLAGTPAKADPLSITLAAPFQSGPENVFAFIATVTNTSLTTVYLNADSFNVDAPLTVDDSPYIDNYPLSLSPGSYTGLLFNVDVPPGTPAGLYAGSFEIIGGGPSDFTDVAGSATFNVDVTPEPGSLILLLAGLTGLAGLGGSLRRRRPAK
jgi:hypothetical protein